MKQIIVKPNGLKKVITINDQPSKTQQQFKDTVDVNNIMKKYKKTGVVTHLRNAAQGLYMDLTAIPDLAEAKMQIAHAEELFMQIPAELRLKFNNDPALLISYLKDPANKKEAQAHGLIKPDPVLPFEEEKAKNESQPK